MGFNKVKACLAAAGLSALASAAQASITQAPALPAQVSITPYSDGAFDSGFSLEALGTARLDGQQWVADVVEVEPGMFKLHADAALRVVLKYDFRLGGGEASPITWKNFAIHIDPSEPVWLPYRVTADRYLEDEFVGRDSFGSLSLAGPHTDPFAIYDDLPEGQALLWHGHYGLVPALADFRSYSITAVYAPTAFASISVTTVPEPAVWQGMGMGLVGLMGVQAARRRQRAVG